MKTYLAIDIQNVKDLENLPGRMIEKLKPMQGFYVWIFVFTTMRSKKKKRF